MAQMRGGKHTETGVEGGQPLLNGLPLPKTIVGEVIDADAVAKASSAGSKGEDPFMMAHAALAMRQASQPSVTRDSGMEAAAAAFRNSANKV